MTHFHIKMHIYCVTLLEQNHVYLSVRGDLWPHKIQQIRLRPGLRPGPAEGAYDAPPDPLVGWGGDTPSPDLTPLGTFGASILAPSALVCAVTNSA